MATAARPAVLLVAAALCVTAAAAAASRDVSPLRSLRTEEGRIDELISRIEQLQKKKREQHHQQQPQEKQRTPLKHSGSAPAAAAHPQRQFAYYPSDPEYRAPRLQKVKTGSGHNKGSSDVTIKAGAGEPAAATVPPAVPVTPTGRTVTTRDRGDPEEVSHEPEREKKSSADTRVVKVQADALLSPAPSRDNMSDIYFIVTVAGVCAMAVGVTVAGGFCYHKMQKRAKAAGDAEYPAYGVTGPSRDLSPSGDRKLAQSAQMYHYQHQKQQMMAMEKTHNGRHGSASDVDSEEENEEGDYTVYECPGLAPTGEMEVKNPLFQDDQTPAPAAPADANGK